MVKESDYKDMKYILTSTMRTKIIISIYEKSKNLEDLRTELEKPSATILHGLKELENLNYVKKLNKYYSLTSNGYMLAVNMIKLIENWYSIDRNKIFWNNHSLNDLPEESIKNLYQLKNSQCISSTNKDLSKAYTTYMDLISNCKNLKIILPIYSENHMNKLIDLIKKGKTKSLEILTTEKVINSIKQGKKYKKALEEYKNIKLSVLDENIKIYLTVSEKFVSLNLFFKDGHYDDSQLLLDKTEEGIIWGNDLFNFYENKTVEK